MTSRAGCYKQFWKATTFIVFSCLFFGAITYKIVLVSGGPTNEYDNHIQFAIKMAEEGRIVLPHFLFQLLTIFHHYILEIFHLPTYSISSKFPMITYDWGVSALIVMLEVYIGIQLLLIYHLKSNLNNNFKYSDNSVYFIAFGVSICTPIFLLAPIDGLFYLGYISPSTIYIIPTQILLKLPSLALFLLTPIAFSEKDNKTNYCVVFGLLVVLSGLAKPNWLIVMIPALGVISAIYFFRGCYINWKIITVVLFCSSAILGWQYFFKFIDASSPIYKSTIIITAPFEVLSYYSKFISIKIILSILFPLCVAFLFWGIARNDFLFKYAWLLFIIGLGYSAFFGESSSYKYSGNFIWCGQIACFMLFVSSASLFFSKCLKTNNKKRIYTCIVIFCAHVFCGLVYYFRSFGSSYF